MDRRALSVAVVAASFVFLGFLAPEARALDPLETMDGLHPAAPSPAPDVVFTTLEGREVRVQDLRGQPVLLGFFTTW